MTTETPSVTHLDHFFSTSAARLDRWRELNAKAQAWAADAHSGKRGARAAVEAALAELRALEDFFAFPGPRLMKTLAERIASDDALGAARLVRRMSGALLSGSYRYDGGEWETADDAADAVPDRLRAALGGGEAHRPYFETLFVTPAPAANSREDCPRDPPPAARRGRDDLRAGAGRQRRGRPPRPSS